MDESPRPDVSSEREPDASRLPSAGMVYRSPADDNRRTTQQVLVPRRSGIHTVMHRGPRLAVAIGLVVVLILGLVAYLPGPAAVGVPAGAVLPTLTIVTASGNTVVVAGTGASGLYLRSAPRRDADIVQIMADGTMLTVVGSPVMNDGTWLPVVTEAGTSGWVAALYTQAK
jgi:hypothetical protein